jgi:hypothetical protein
MANIANQVKYLQRKHTKLARQHRKVFVEHCRSSDLMAECAILLKEYGLTGDVPEYPNDYSLWNMRNIWLRHFNVTRKPEHCTKCGR